jgi:hypothetical protein
VVISLFCKDPDSCIKNHLLGLFGIFLCPSHQIPKLTNKQFVCKCYYINIYKKSQ